MRLVARARRRGSSRARRRRSRRIPNNHRSYALQWFVFAADRARHLRAWRCAKRLEARPNRRSMMKLTTLANGLRVASRPMPSVETVAVGLYAATGSRHEPARLNGIAHLFEHMVFKGAGGRSAREISEAVEDVGGDLNASHRPRAAPASTGLCAGRACAARRRAARRPGPAARISTPTHLELEKEVVLQELAEARDTASDIVFDDLQERRLRRPAARPVGARRRDEHRARSRVDDLHAWREPPVSRRPAWSWSRPASSSMSGWSTSPRPRSATCPTASSAPPSRRASPAAAASGGASSDQAHLALGLRGAGLERARRLYRLPAVRRHRRRRRVVAAVPAAARGAGPRLFGLAVGAQPYRRLPACSGSMSRDRARRRLAAPR